MVPRSMRSVGEERRSFIAWTSDCPPARSRASPFASAAASFTFEGRWYLNACMSVSLRCFSVLKRTPYGLRRGRHREIFDADRIGDGVHQRGGRADCAGFAASLHAEWVVRTGRLAGVDLERRQVVGAGNAIVHERAREELSARVVLAALGKGLANALRKSAVHLAIDDHRVDDLAEIVHCGEALDLRRPGIRIDFHLAYIGAGGKREVRRIVERVFVQARLELVVR